MARKRKGAGKLQQAPGELRLVQAFVNTVRATGSDELASPRALGEWLARHRLLPSGTELDDADLERARAVRGAWRSLFDGSADGQEVAETLDRAMASALVRGRHGGDGLVRLEPAADGLDGALGKLLAIRLTAQNDGSWQQLKVCASAACRTVFFDRSTNRSGRWCRPRCGNRKSSRLSKRRSRLLKRQQRRL